MDNPVAVSRGQNVTDALRLEYFTVGWNVIEGVIAVVIALAAGSVALLGFGIDSFVECISGLILIWRLRAEQRTQNLEALEVTERRALRLVGTSLFLLAAWVAADATRAIYTREQPSPSIFGIVLLLISIIIMRWLAKAKRRLAHALDSRALEADAFQTTACWWLSIITLGGIGLNALLGWWWADPVAALGMTWFLVKEGREAWVGEDTCRCHDGCSKETT